MTDSNDCKATTETYRCMNWPPSRGPMPAGPRREFHFPPSVLEGPLPMPEGEDEDDLEPPSSDPAREEHDRLMDLVSEGHGYKASDMLRLTNAFRYYELRVWASVRDLLQAGPGLSDRLVIAADAGKQHGTAVHLPARTFQCDLSYPLGHLARVTIAPFAIRWPEIDRKSTLWMSVGWVLWSLADAYRQIYERHEEFGVWGHAIDDLCFETLTLKDDRIVVGVGS